MTTTNVTVTVPESLVSQKSELETILANIAKEEQKLASQRSDIQAALRNIDTCIALLKGEPVPQFTERKRKPMSDEARKKLSESLRKTAAAKRAAKEGTGSPAVDGKMAAANDVDMAEALNLAELNRGALKDAAKAELDKRVAGIHKAADKKPAASAKKAGRK